MYFWGMGNSFFRFKQFETAQDRCGMKVSTDACILGAYTYKKEAGSVLDIGTGTGLLSLMAAQKHEKAFIDAVETEANACEQAADNFRKSPWSSRIKVYHTPVQEFFPEKQYDLIICNPPFYSGHLPSPDSARNQAFHQISLRFTELAAAIRRLLAPEGETNILLPLRQAMEFTETAKAQGLRCNKELLVTEKDPAKPHRSIRTYSFNSQEVFSQEILIIRAPDGTYSRDFQNLLFPYYTIF